MSQHSFSSLLSEDHGSYAASGAVIRLIRTADVVLAHVRELMHGRCVLEAPTTGGESCWFRLPLTGTFSKFIERVQMAGAAAAKEGPFQQNCGPRDIAVRLHKCIEQLLDHYRATLSCVGRWGVERALLDCAGLLHGPASYCNLFWQFQTLVYGFLCLGNQELVDGNVEDWLDNQWELQEAFEKAFEVRAQYATYDHGNLISDFPTWLESRSSITYTEIQDWVEAHVAGIESHYATWLVFRLCASKRFNVVGDATNLIRIYAEHIGGEETETTLVMDDMPLMQVSDCVLPYFAIGNDGGLYFESSEGFGFKVIQHLRRGRIGEYVFDRAEVPEDAHRVRHLIAMDDAVHAITSLEGGNLRMLVNLIQESHDDIGRTFGDLVAANTAAELNTAAVAVFSALSSASNADGGYSLLRRNISISRLVRWARKLRSPSRLMAYVLRHIICGISSKEAHIKVTLDSVTVDITVGGAIEAVAAVIDRGVVDRRASYLVRSTGEICRILQHHGSTNAQWIAVLAGELSDHQSTYVPTARALGTIDPPEMYNFWLARTPGLHLFDVDRSEDIAEY